MRRIFFILIMLFTCQVASADLILLKNGEIIEGKIVQVRGLFVRVLAGHDSPFKEFLIEDVINIEQSSPDEVSQLTVRNIHQRAINKANSGVIQDAVNKRATALLEEAISSSEITSLDQASDAVKRGAQEKASALIGEAVKSAGIPRLDQISLDAQNSAEQKAGVLIEEAVKTVEVSPLQRAPNGVQEAVKHAATALVGDAVKDARGQSGIAQWFRSFFRLTLKDQIMGVLLVLLVVLLFQEKRKSASSEVKDDTLNSSLKEIDEELKKFDQTSEEDETSQDLKNQWEEKRGHKRVEWNFPISLSLDENNPIFAMVKDISLDGAYAVCNDVSLLRTLGDQTKFKFNFDSKDPNFPINGSAQVVRIKSNRGLGLKFSDLDETSIGYLQSLY